MDCCGVIVGEQALRFNFDDQSICEELVKDSTKNYYRERLRRPLVLSHWNMKTREGHDWPYLRRTVLEQAISSVDKLQEHKEKIIEMFEEKKWSIDEWPPEQVNRKQFKNMVLDNVFCESNREDRKKMTQPALKLFGRIGEEIHKIKGRSDSNGEDDDYRGYQGFRVWCSSETNILHRLRYLTFVVCKYLNDCTPSIIELRIPRNADRV